MHISDDRTFGAYGNAVEALNSTSAALPALDNFVLGRLAQFQTAINAEGYPGGTYTTPSACPASPASTGITSLRSMRTTTGASAIVSR